VTVLLIAIVAVPAILFALFCLHWERDIRKAWAELAERRRARDVTADFIIGENPTAPPPE
jgi:hypothetical protein